MLAAGGPDSSSPIIPVFDPKSVGASPPGQCSGDVGGEEWCGGTAPLCPATDTVLAAPCSLALRNIPHLMLAHEHGSMGKATYHRSSSAVVTREQTARESGHISERDIFRLRRLIK